MKVGGKNIKRYTGTVHILRPDGDGGWNDLAIQVRQLPLSWDAEAAEQIPCPVPKPVSNRLVIDKTTGEKVPEVDPDAPENQRAHNEWVRRRMAKRIYDGTLPGQAEWDTDTELLTADPEKFYDGILAELHESFSSQEVVQWSSTILGIGQVAGYDVAQIEKHFFQVHSSLQGLSAGNDGAQDELDGGIPSEVSRPANLQGVGDEA